MWLVFTASHWNTYWDICGGLSTPIGKQDDGNERKKVICHLAASTGLHDAAAAIRQLLAGADAVQVASCLYKNGPQYLKELLDGLETWMATKRYSKLSDFKGKLSQERSSDPAVCERAQLMRYFGGKQNVML